ncbi:MAG TPA: cytochrome P450 [Myxococcaceae bacterium]|nr:cytochrome P450 [Myxococcaceae bacterium]
MTASASPSDPYGFGIPETWHEPYPLYARLREEAPVYYSEAWKSWVLTRCADAGVMKDPRVSARRSGGFAATLPEEIRRMIEPLIRNLSMWVLLTDPPDHTRLRGLINKAFTPRLTEQLRPRIQRLVTDLLDEAAKKDEIDLMKDFAVPLPVTVIGELMGLPRENRHRLKEWADDVLHFMAGTRRTPESIATSVRALVELETYLREVFAERRRHPGEDLLSHLLAAEEQGQVLSEQELLSTCTVVLFGGHETTVNLICNAVHALFAHPAELEKLRRSPELMPSAVEEFLRYDTPVQRIGRVAKEDLELGGQRIQKGQALWLMIGSANRDPAHFPDPDRLDVARRDNRHVAFGTGAHFCVGAPLGRLEGQLAMAELLRRFPRLEPAGKPSRLESATMRGFNSYPLRLGAPA